MSKDYNQEISALVKLDFHLKCPYFLFKSHRVIYLNYYTAILGSSKPNKYTKIPHFLFILFHDLLKAT